MPAGPAESDSTTDCAHYGVPLAEQSLTSQESCNHTDKVFLKNDCTDACPVSDNDKNGESGDGSHVFSPLPTDSTTFAEQDEIGPLSGNPYFTTIITKSSLQHVVVPKRFQPNLPHTSIKVVLSRRKKDWEMRYCGSNSLPRFDRGWRQFAADNNLRIGDGCVFELMDSKIPKLKVRVLSGEIPTQSSDNVDGSSSNRPITID